MVARSISVRRTKAAGINRIRKNVRALLTSTPEGRTAVHRITRRARSQVHAISNLPLTRVCTANGTEDAPVSAGEHRQEHGGRYEYSRRSNGADGAGAARGTRRLRVPEQGSSDIDAEPRGHGPDSGARAGDSRGSAGNCSAVNDSGPGDCVGSRRVPRGALAALWRRPGGAVLLGLDPDWIEPDGSSRAAGETRHLRGGREF